MSFVSHFPRLYLHFSMQDQAERGMGTRLVLGFLDCNLNCCRCACTHVPSSQCHGNRITGFLTNAHDCHMPWTAYNNILLIYMYSVVLLALPKLKLTMKVYAYSDPQTHRGTIPISACCAFIVMMWSYCTVRDWHQ